MRDTIYREAALKALSWDTEAYMVINNLPSAQPEIVRCKDCVYWDLSGYCVDFMTQDENGFCSWAKKENR